MAIQQITNPAGRISIVDDNWDPLTRQLYDDLEAADCPIYYAQANAIDKVIKGLRHEDGAVYAEYFPATSEQVYNFPLMSGAVLLLVIVEGIIYIPKTRTTADPPGPLPGADVELDPATNNVTFRKAVGEGQQIMIQYKK